jgi:hypothetical protein
VCTGLQASHDGLGLRYRRCVQGKDEDAESFQFENSKKRSPANAETQKQPRGGGKHPQRQREAETFLSKVASLSSLSHNTLRIRRRVRFVCCAAFVDNTIPPWSGWGQIQFSLSEFSARASRMSLSQLIIDLSPSPSPSPPAKVARKVAPVGGGSKQGNKENVSINQRPAAAAGACCAPVLSFVFIFSNSLLGCYERQRSQRPLPLTPGDHEVVLTGEAGQGWMAIPHSCYRCRKHPFGKQNLL